MKRRMLSDYLGHLRQAASPGAGAQLSGVILGELRTSTRHAGCLFHTERDEAVDVGRSRWKDFRTLRFMQLSQQNSGTSLKNGSEGHQLSVCPTWMGTAAQARVSRAVCRDVLG